MNVLDKIIIACKPFVLFNALVISLLSVTTSGNYSNAFLLVLSGVLASAFVYFFNSFNDIKEDMINESAENILSSDYERRVSIIVLGFFLFFALFLSFISSISSFFVVIAILLLGFFYSFKIKGFRFKEIPLLKNVIISFGWGLLFFIGSTSLNFINIFWFLFIFVIFFNFGSIADIRDIQGDISTGIKTFSFMIGVRNIIYLLIIINLLSILFILYGIYVGALPFYLILTIFIMAIISGGLIAGFKHGVKGNDIKKINYKLWRHIHATIMKLTAVLILLIACLNFLM